MVQSPHLGWDMDSALEEGNQPDPCFSPMLEPGQEINGRGRKPLGTGGWLENRRLKPFENRVNATLEKVNPKWS